MKNRSLSQAQRKVIDALKAGKRVLTIANPVTPPKTRYAWVCGPELGEALAEVSKRTIMCLRAQRLLTVERCAEDRRYFEYKLREET